MATLGAATAKPLAPKGTLPGAPLVRHWNRRLCRDDQRDRQRARVYERVVHGGHAEAHHLDRPETAIDRPGAERRRHARLPWLSIRESGARAESGSGRGCLAAAR